MRDWTVVSAVTLQKIRDRPAAIWASFWPCSAPTERFDDTVAWAVKIRVTIGGKYSVGLVPAGAAASAIIPSNGDRREGADAY